jgi:hypothetical protein
MRGRRLYDHHLTKSSSILSDMGLRDGADLVTPLGALLGGAGGYGLYRLWLKNIADPKKLTGWDKNVPLAAFLASGALIGGRLGHDAENNIRYLARDAAQAKLTE